MRINLSPFALTGFSEAHDYVADLYADPSRLRERLKLECIWSFVAAFSRQKARERRLQKQQPLLPRPIVIDKWAGTRWTCRHYEDGRCRITAPQRTCPFNVPSRKCGHWEKKEARW